MKKQVRIISTILMIIMIIASLSSIVLGAESTLNALKNPGTVNGVTEVQNLGKQMVGILQVIGIVVAVVVLLVLGIKYMMGSAEEKAEYKKIMIPYLVGALLIFAATTIVNVVYNVFSNIKV